jgi:hypothetical protein
MNNFSCLILIITGALICASAFNAPKMRIMKSELTMNKFSQSNLMRGLTRGATALSILSLPTENAYALDGGAAGAVGVPLAISIVVMVPFIYYANALAPKERDIKQIEVDGQLREKGKRFKTGKEGVAKAGKKK